MADLHNGVSRRGFLAASLSGLVAAGMASVPAGIARARETKEKVTDKKIIRRQLGKTGITLPIASMGVMNSNNPEVVHASYQLGIRHFDTAAAYGFGRNELMVGDVIKRLGARNDVILATKVCRPEQRGGMTVAEAKTKFIGQVEGSLRRLKTDYLDIIYIHSMHNVEELNESGAFEAVAQLKKDGKVRATGVSTHESMAVVINEVARAGLCDVVLTSFNVSMADDAELLGAIDKAAKQGIGIVAMKTQAGGGRLPNQAALQQYSSSVINKASLKWVLRNENISTAIPGYTNFEHMNENFSVASDLEYIADEQKFLADNNLKLSLGFCRQCRKCTGVCPHGVDIPRLMRTHMYAAQYANFAQARATLDRIPHDRGLVKCTSCSSCTVNCNNCVDVPRKIEELKLMYA